MSKTVSITFLYALGQLVRWLDLPGAVYGVIERHAHESAVSHWRTYTLQHEEDGRMLVAYEADLDAVEGEA